ncbi:hypothetical protein RQP46_006144 [Phenoliferia psychrophenolica]
MADAHPKATLTSLPHELIEAIAWLVAPEGGRKAANLRLACRAVDTAAAPCVWTAITFPSAPEEVDLLLSHLIENPHKRVEFTSSVRIDATTPLVSTIAALLPTFPRLKRVHISGAAAEHTFIELSPLLMRAIDRSPTIRTLAFESISFANQLDQPVWALAVPEVTFQGCPEDWSDHAGPLEVVLHGLQGLFDEADFEQQSTAGIFTVGLLNWMRCVSTLSLPVHAVFNYSDQFSLLSLPNLQHLALVRQSILAADIPDLLSTSTVQLPALTTLRLRGWLDTTSVKTVALAYDSDLPRRYLEVYGLLVCLRTTGVVQLRLQNSIGHPDELEECVLERDDKDATVWRKRQVTFF